MADEKKDVVVEEATDEVERARAQAPSGVQDLNAIMEPDPNISLDLAGTVERVLTDDVHVDMGRGALTFKPGDKVTITDGSIRKVVTRDGQEYEFTPAHVAAAEKAEAEQPEQPKAAAPPPPPPPPKAEAAPKKK